MRWRGGSIGRNLWWFAWAVLFALFQTMAPGFVERADAVTKILSDRRTTFVVVSTLEAAPLHEAEYFIEALDERKLHLVVVARRGPTFHHLHPLIIPLDYPLQQPVGHGVVKPVPALAHAVDLPYPAAVVLDKPIVVHSE